MTKDDIIRMAREAGMIGTNQAGNELERLYREAILDALPRFAALVAAAEREACAKMCYDKSWELKNEAMKSESKTKGVRLNDCAIVLYDAHKAIRARREQ